MAVCNTLEAANLPCWISPRDLIPGVEWATELLDALSTAKVLILVFSKHANHSVHVMREVERAVSLRLPILPLRFDTTQYSKSLEYFLSAFQWTDVSSDLITENLQTIPDIVRQLLKRRRPSAKSPANTHKFDEMTEQLLDEFLFAFASAGLEEGPATMPRFLDLPVLSVLAWNAELMATSRPDTIEDNPSASSVLPCFHWLVEGYCLSRFLVTESLIKEELPADIPDTSELITRWRHLLVSEEWMEDWTDTFVISLVHALVSRSEQEARLELGSRKLSRDERRNVKHALLIMKICVLQGLVAHRYIMLGAPVQRANSGA